MCAASGGDALDGAEHAPEDQFAVRMLKAGAAGYLTKETATEELVKACAKC